MGMCEHDIYALVIIRTLTLFVIENSSMWPSIKTIWYSNLT